MLTIALVTAPRLAQAEPPSVASCETDDGSAVCCQVDLRPGDEVWLIDTRDVGCNFQAKHWHTRLRVNRLGPDLRWQRAKLENLLDGDQTPFQTIVWVHGNRVYRDEARSRGLEIYTALIPHVDENTRVRFVVFSWPSAKTGIGLRDVREKAYLTEPAAYHLAWLIDRIDPDAPLGLAGFSFGARVITGALHMLGGKPVGDYRLSERKHPERKPVRSVLMAAALDDDWLLPGHYHGRALSQTARMLLLNNSCDRALERYHWLDRCSHPYALGYWGLASPADLGAARKKIHQRDVGSRVGRIHEVWGYVDDEDLMRSAAKTLLSDAVAAGPRLSAAGD